MQSKILDALRSLAEQGLSVLDEPGGQPETGDYRLPDDAVAFYAAYGGAILFEDAPYPTRVLSWDELQPIDAIMWGGEPAPDDSSRSWFLVADDVSGNYLSIDLSQDRLGWIYDTQIGRYGVPGYCTIIALSFSEFVERSIGARGERFYWLQEGFVSYGDAYQLDGATGAAPN